MRDSLIASQHTGMAARRRSTWQRIRPTALAFCSLLLLVPTGRGDVPPDIPTIHLSILDTVGEQRASYRILVPATTTPGWWRELFLFGALDDYDTRVQRYRGAFVAAVLQPELTTQLGNKGNLLNQLSALAQRVSDIASSTGTISDDFAKLLRILRGGDENLPITGTKAMELLQAFKEKRPAQSGRLADSLDRLSIALGAISLVAQLRADVTRDIFLHSIVNASVLERLDALNQFVTGPLPDDPAIRAGFDAAKRDVDNFLSKDVSVLQSTLDTFTSNGVNYVVELSVYLAGVAEQFQLIAPEVTATIDVYYLAYRIGTQLKADIDDMQVMCAAATLDSLLWQQVDRLSSLLPAQSDPAYPGARRLLLTTAQIRYGIGYWYNSKYDKILAADDPYDWIQALAQLATGVYGSVVEYRRGVLQPMVESNLESTVEINEYLRYGSFSLLSVLDWRAGNDTATNIYVQFNRMLDLSSVNDSTITVGGTATGGHSATFTINSSNYALTIDPVMDFGYGETVTVVIGTGVRDLAGSGLASPYTFSFVIQSAPTPPDFSISVTPTARRIGAGDGTFYTVTLTAGSSFSGTVTVSATGAPDTCLFTTAGSSVGSQSLITIALPAGGTAKTDCFLGTSESDVLGDYGISFSGASGTLRHSAAAVLTLVARPVIDSLSPPTGIVGGGDFLLTIDGQHFMRSSRVQVEGFDRPTTFRSDTQLVAFIPAADIATHTTLHVEVKNYPDPSAAAVSLSNTVLFRVTYPVPLLSSLSPPTCVAGSGAFTLYLDGINFLPTRSQVLWNGSAKPTGFISNTRLAVDVPASDVASGGPVEIKVSNIGGGLSNPLSFVIADFSVGVAPSSQTVTAGNAATYTVTITGTGGFSSSVTLSCSGLPSGASCSFSPQPATPGTSTLTVSTSTSTPQATTTFGVAGTSGSLSHDATPAPSITVGSQPDFSLSISPSSQTVTAGSTASYTVTITGTGGFNSAVALSCGGLPSGASCTFSPQSPTPGTATLTLSTSASTPQGTTTFTVVGASGSVSHNVTPPPGITVNPQPDFSLSVSPPSQTVTAGNAASYTVAITGIGGFNSQVTLGCGGLPSGASCSFSPPSATPGASSTLTLSTSITTPEGTVTFTVSGTSGSLSHAATGTVNVSRTSQWQIQSWGNSYAWNVAQTGFSASAVTFTVSGNTVSGSLNYNVFDQQNPTAIAQLFVAVERKVVYTLYNGIPGSGGASGSRQFSFTYDSSQHGLNPTIYLAGTWAVSEETGRYHYEQQGGGWRAAIGVIGPAGWPQLTLNVVPVGVLSAQPGQAPSYTVTVTSAGVPVAGATVGVSDLLCERRSTLTTGANGQAPYSCTVAVGKADGPYPVTFEPASASGYLNSRDAASTVTVSQGSQLQVQSWGNSYAWNLAQTGFSASAVTFTISGNTISGSLNYNVFDQQNPTAIAQLFVALGREVVYTLYNSIPGSGGASGSRQFSFTYDSSQHGLNPTIYLAGTWAVSEETGRYHYEQQGGGWRAAIGVMGPAGWPQLTLNVVPVGVLSAQPGQTLTYTVTVTSAGLPVAGAAVGVSDLLCGCRSTLTTGSSGQAGYSCTVAAGQTPGPYPINFEPASTSGYLNSRDAASTANIPQIVPTANPVPVLTSLSPASAALGGAAFTLTANGSNFVSNSVIRWNGSARTTTYVSATQVTAAMPASDIAAAGTAQVTVFNPAPGGGTSSAVNFSIMPLTCDTYSVSPATQNLAATAGTGSFQVTTGAGCLWTAATAYSWITITSGISGSGNGTVSYGVSANSGTRRTGTIVVNGQKFTLVQDGAITAQGILTLGPAQGTPGGTARIPVTLALNSAVSADSVAFSLQVTPVSPAPPLAGALSFTQDAALTPPTLVDTGTGPDVISVSWMLLANAMTGSRALGNVVATVPASAADGQNYTVRLLGVTASTGSGSIEVALEAGPETTLSVVTRTYMAGDVYPFLDDLNGDGDKDDAGEFGDGRLNIVDLIQALRAVTNVPGFRPPQCTDRFDAMDTFPVDTESSVGGDGKLSIVDLIITLRRVTGVDSSRPGRVSRSAACAAGATRNGTPLPAEAGGYKPGGASDERAPEAMLSFGPAEGGSGSSRVPLYLTAQQELFLVGFAASLGVENERDGFRLRFAGGAQPPTVTDGALLGVLSVAWLDGLWVRPGDRLLLGYIEVEPQAGAAVQVPPLVLFGADAFAGKDQQAVRVSMGEPR